MTSNHLFSFIREAATLEQRPFLETPARRKLSYGDVLAGSARYANVLTAAGVEPGHRVAAQVEKSPEALLLYLGAVRAGAVFLPLNTAYTKAELDYFIGDAEPSLVVCDPTKREALSGSRPKRQGARPRNARWRGRRQSRGRGHRGFPRIRGRGASAERPCRHPLHFGDDGAVKRRDAHSRQSRLECLNARALLALQRGRRAPARACRSIIRMGSSSPPTPSCSAAPR